MLTQEAYQFKCSVDSSAINAESSSSHKISLCVHSSFASQREAHNERIKPECVGTTHPTAKWLKTVLLPKLTKWMSDSRDMRTGSGPLVVRKSLVDIGRYSQLYRELKLKYGPTLVQVNCPLSNS